MDKVTDVNYCLGLLALLLLQGVITVEGRSIFNYGEYAERAIFITWIVKMKMFF